METIKLKQKDIDFKNWMRQFITIFLDLPLEKIDTGMLKILILII